MHFPAHSSFYAAAAKYAGGIVTADRRDRGTTREPITIDKLSVKTDHYCVKSERPLSSRVPGNVITKLFSSKSFDVAR